MSSELVLDHFKLAVISCRRPTREFLGYTASKDQTSITANGDKQDLPLVRTTNVVDKGLRFQRAEPPLAGQQVLVDLPHEAGERVGRGSWLEPAALNRD